MATAEPSASSPENPKPLLRDYSVEDVQDGIALVDGRYGPQQVVPGDFIPGAGRVLRIERRWFDVTSLGVIASGPPASEAGSGRMRKRAGICPGLAARLVVASREFAPTAICASLGHGRPVST